LEQKNEELSKENRILELSEEHLFKLYGDENDKVEELEIENEKLKNQFFLKEFEIENLKNEKE